MTAIVLPFAPPAEPRTFSSAFVDPSRVSYLSVDEACLLTQLLMACAPHRPDRLDAAPASKRGEREPYQPIVIVTDRGLDVIMSADTARRLAVEIDAAGRLGAALDLMEAADKAEALSAHMQRSVH